MTDRVVASRSRDCIAIVDDRCDGEADPLDLAILVLDAVNTRVVALPRTAHGARRTPEIVRSCVGVPGTHGFSYDRQVIVMPGTATGAPLASSIGYAVPVAQAHRRLRIGGRFVEPSGSTAGPEGLTRDANNVPSLYA